MFSKMSEPWFPADKSISNLVIENIDLLIYLDAILNYPKLTIVQLWNCPNVIISDTLRVILREKRWTLLKSPGLITVSRFIYERLL